MFFPKDDFDFLAELETDLRKSTYRKGACVVCFRRLLPESDEYWGREHRGTVLCYDCRKKEGIEG